MKLLFDQNISHRLINRIQDILSHSHQVRELNLENATDKEIWEYAKENGFTIVTFDADFYDLGASTKNYLDTNAPTNNKQG
jgi:predicted nuclease of predicted toxin-antitoxin system